VIKKLLFLL